MIPSGHPPPSYQQLVDNHGRAINYLRLAITDRCNLRCRYCRPEQGVPFIPHDEILSLEELERLVTIFCRLGVVKVRVTGGEPFSRRGCISFLEKLRQVKGLGSLHVTTNGVKTLRFLDELKIIPIDGINLSLDTLDPKKFAWITRRDFLDSVLLTLHGVLKRQIPLKINSVVLPDTSDEEMISLAGLAKKFPLTLRFIEIMPFSGRVRAGKLVNGNLMARLHRLFPQLEEFQAPNSTTARVFTHPGYIGRLGAIQGHSREFCSQCNKLRITPTGMLKTCLYDTGVLDLKGMLRNGSGDREIADAVAVCVRTRYVNGHEAERNADRKAERNAETNGKGFADPFAEPSMGMIGG